MLEHAIQLRAYELYAQRGRAGGHAVHDWLAAEAELLNGHSATAADLDLLQRIAEARSAVLDRIEDGFSKPSDGEQLALRDALETLGTLRKIAERDTVEQKKTGT
jgi:hypothetical protein